MKLKATLANKGELEALPEAVRAFYVEKDGKYALSVDGMVSEAEYDEVNTKLVEFRENNRTLHKKVTEFETRYKDVDPDKYRTQATELEKLQKAGIGKADDFSAQVAKAVADAVNPLNDRMKAIEDERNKAQAQLSERDRDDALWSVGQKAGVKESAKEFYLTAARKVWQRTEKGELVAKNGETPLYSKQRGKATDPLSLEEWATQWLPQEADFLYKTSGGGGANNDKGGPGGPGLVANDPFAIGQNLEKLAKGEATVAGVAAQ